jgi:protein TonB
VARPNPNSAAPAALASARAHATPIGPPNPPQTSEAPQAAISPGWQSAVGAWLQSNKTYPDAARRRGEEGRATVRFTVNREGRVIDFGLLSGTGSEALDAAVDRLLRGARLPSFPRGMPQDQVTVTLQIRYTLER